MAPFTVHWQEVLKYAALGIFFVAVIYLLVHYMKNAGTSKESFQSYSDAEEEIGIPQPSDSKGDETYKMVSSSDTLRDNQFPNDCYPKDQLSPSDLLPSDTNSTWAQVNPIGQGDLKDKNFLDAGYHIGVNTVGQTLRNANYQVRSEPPNPQVKVSPWMQTTIEPDSNRRPLEIGA